MSGTMHETVAIRVWADVDVGIADAVRRLNEIPGIRTHASCQGTIGEGGAEPYGPYVMFSWSDGDALEAVCREFDVTPNAGASNLACASPRNP